MTRIAICGTGNIGRVHVENLLSLRGCELAGVFDTRRETLEAVCAEYGVAAYADLDAMLGDGRVDAVVVATPSDSHEEVAVKAFAAGKHVFIEKPLAGSFAECERILAAAAASGRVAQAGFCERFNVNYLEAHRAVAAGKVGAVRAIHTSRWAPYAYSNPAWTLGVLDTAVHNLDLILWLFGRMPRSVLARGTRVYADSAIPHTATILLSFDDGAMAVEHIAWLDDRGHPLNQCARSRMMIQGSDGLFFVDLTDRPSALLSGGEYRMIDSVILGSRDYAGCLKLQFDYFLRSIEQGAPVLAPLEDAVRTERVALAAKESLESGREVLL
ncbi:MAG: Gfo/Idh/MocA family protein [Bryobacteraceae bacterium]